MTKNALLMTTVAGGLLLGLYLAWSGSAATPPVGTDPKSSGTRAAPDNASRTGQETTRTRPPEAAKPSTGARGPFESLSHVLAAHLTPAPEDAQAAAATLFEQQARHFEEQAADALSTESLRGVMHAIDCEFSATLRREAAEQLRRGEGLLVVNGNDYSKRIAGKQWLLWGGGLRYHGKGVEVLVVFDVPSAKLAELDRSLRQARAVFLADTLQHFNNLPYEERRAVVQRYRDAVELGQAHEQSWFGIDSQYLPFVKVQPSICQVVPTEF